MRFHCISNFMRKFCSYFHPNIRSFFFFWDTLYVCTMQCLISDWWYHTIDNPNSAFNSIRPLMHLQTPQCSDIVDGGDFVLFAVGTLYAWGGGRSLKRLAKNRKLFFAASFKPLLVCAHPVTLINFCPFFRDATIRIEYHSNEFNWLSEGKITTLVLKDGGNIFHNG